MVINKDTNRAKQKEAEAKLSRSDDEIKNEIFEKMRAESVAVITLAYYYAKNFEETGEDITQKWITAEQQADALQRYYNKGFSEGYQQGIQKGREYERKKMEKLNKKFNKGNAVNGGGNINSPNWHNSV